MRLISGAFVNRYEGRILNIHPSLLPLFPGLHTHQRAIDAGMRVAGCTVHFVTEGMDEGPDFQDPRIAALMASAERDRPVADSSRRVGREGREFCIYPGQLGYDMQEELDFLSNRVMEANVFFTGRLLAPAMPRIDDKTVRFALIRDENGARSRMRFLMPFTVEKRDRAS